MIIDTLSIFVTAYSLFAIVFMIASLYVEFRFGIDKFAKIVNERYAKKKALIIFEIFSWLVVVVWLVLGLTFVDLTTFQFFTHFEGSGVSTLLGSMDSRKFDVYFLVMFFNILGVKAAWLFAQVAHILRKGYVRLIKRGFFIAVIPEKVE